MELKLGKLGHSITRSNKIIIGLYQPNITPDMFDTDSNLQILINDKELFDREIFNVICSAIDYGCNYIVFPELFMNKLFFEFIKKLFIDQNIIIIGGSFYRKGINSCPIIYKKDIFFTDKINPTTGEIVPYEPPSIIGGTNINYIKSMYGNFVVLICGDFLVEETIPYIFNELKVRKQDLDIIFIISFNNNTNAFEHKISSLVESNVKGIYICYCNTIGRTPFNLETDGKTSIYGYMKPAHLSYLMDSGLKPIDDVKYKICELDDNQKLLIAELDLENKRAKIYPGLKPNIIIKQPNPLTIRFVDREYGEYYDKKYKEIKDIFKQIKDKNIIYKILNKYIENKLIKMDEIHLEKLKEHVISEVELTLKEICEKFKDKPKQKVKNWKEIIDKDKNINVDIELNIQNQMIIVCKQLSEIFPDVSSELNVISYGVISNKLLDSIIITGRNTKKSIITKKELVIVKKQFGKYKFNSPGGIYPSSETAVNWAIHNETNKNFVIHLNTKKILEFAQKIIVDRNFDKIIIKHPFIELSHDGRLMTYEQNKNSKYYIVLVEEATNIDVKLLADKIATSFQVSIGEHNNLDDCIIIGEGHSSWFVIDELGEAIDKAVEYDNIISEINDHYKWIQKGKIICSHCKGKVHIIQIYGNLKKGFCENCKLFTIAK